MKKLDYLFKARNVAVVGVSRNPKKIGHVIFRNFIEGGFEGKVFPVNPNADEIQGHKCYPSVAVIKEKIDLAVICVPAPMVPGILTQCGKRNVPAVIVISGGFKEVGNVELEEECVRIAKRYGMRMIGPNCIGVFDPESGVDTFFLPRYKLERPVEGDIAFISQSGALGSVVLDWMAMKGYRISRFVSYGNAADVDEADLVEYLSGDRKTKVICAYFEGVKRGRKFYEAAKKVSRKKPIIALKGGITKEGTSAVSSHTGSMAGSSEIYSAAFRQSGVIEARGLEQLFDFARVLSSQPRPRGDRVQIITNGGGFGVLTADWVSKAGLRLAEMKKHSLERIEKVVPKHAVLGNPIDLTGDATTERYRVAIEAAMDDSEVDMVIVIGLLQIPTLTADIVDVVSACGKRRRKPLVFIAAGGRFTEVLKKSLEDLGTPTFSYPERAVESLRVLYDYYNRRLLL